MVFRDIVRHHEEQQRKHQEKLYCIKGQMMECFFTIHTHDDIKKNIKSSMDKPYLPTFRCRYKTRSGSEKVEVEKYVEVMEDSLGKLLVVDFDFLNLKANDGISHSSLEISPLYKKNKKLLGSDFYFKIDGRTEDGNIEIHFCEVYRPFLSRLFNW